MIKPQPSSKSLGFQMPDSPKGSLAFYFLSTNAPPPLTILIILSSFTHLPTQIWKKISKYTYQYKFNSYVS